MSRVSINQYTTHILCHWYLTVLACQLMLSWLIPTAMRYCWGSFLSLSLYVTSLGEAWGNLIYHNQILPSSDCTMDTTTEIIFLSWHMTLLWETYWLLQGESWALARFCELYVCVCTNSWGLAGSFNSCSSNYMVRGWTMQLARIDSQLTRSQLHSSIQNFAHFHCHFSAAWYEYPRLWCIHVCKRSL